MSDDQRLPIGAALHLPHAALRLAVEFWSSAGGPPGFPRDAEPLIALHTPLSVRLVPALSVAAATAFAARLGLTTIEAAPDRRLRGCLLVHGGQGFLLVDPADPPAERRLTVAHELGHFCIEVQEPRRRVARAAGRAALAVLDGARPPTVAERLDALLGDASLAPHVHLMTREDDGSIGCARVATAECAADGFALELLAPAAALRGGVLALAGLPLQQRWAIVTKRLTDQFGLPQIAAGGYARALVAELTGGESVREWLRP